MNQGCKEALSFINDLKKFQTTSDKKMILLIPSSYFYMAQNLKGIFWGGQNCFCQNKGNFTGEISPHTMKEMGASYCLVGHSERRTLFNETLSLIKNKFDKIVENQMTPILCVGENEDQRKKDQVKSVLMEQLKDYKDSSNFIVAYEPLWAIGTGERASISQIQEAVYEIRKRIKSSIPILYGGSVSLKNVEELLKIQGLKGFLIGKSSLDVNEFISIYQKC